MPKNTIEATDDATLMQKGKQGLLRIIFGRTMLILLLLLINFGLAFCFIFEIMQGLPILFGSLEVFTAVMLVCVINSRENPSIKLTWAIVIATVPVLGAGLYFMVRLDLGHRVTKKMLELSIQASAPFVPEPREELVKIRHADRNLYNLARYLQKFGSCPVYAHSNVKYFPLGEDMFDEMLLHLENAEKFIFMEYFLISEGYMWSRILDVLQRKAQQGVEVRVLYDGMNAITNLPYGYPKKLEKLGIRCKMFAPVRPFVSTHYNNRDHRKILVIDGHTAFTGGINLEDHYINRESFCGHWKDTAVMVRGEAVQGFTIMFLQMWNANERERIFAPYLSVPQDPPESTGYVIPYGDSPMDDENVGEMVYLNMLNQAQDYVYIMTPYLIPDNEIITALCFAAKRGVDVRLITPGIPDKRTIFAVTRSHYGQLLDAGVKIYEYTPGFVHAKVFLCDDVHAVVGTINLDYRSLYHHFECGAYLYKVPALADIKKDFADTIQKSERISTENVKKWSPLSRILGAFLRVVAPLL